MSSNIMFEVSEMIGCKYFYHIDRCSPPSEDMNFISLVQYASTRSGVNLINVLQAAFVLVDPKSEKKLLTT
jgi:hypothetical protein